MDMALVAHLSTLESSVPFLHFFDGFRTSPEVQKIDAIDYKDIEPLCPGQGQGPSATAPSTPTIRIRPVPRRTPTSTSQNREAANKFYNATPALVEEA